MCCVMTVLLMLGPRAGILVWWLVNPTRFTLAFGGSFMWPLLGFLFLPWTALAYLLVAPSGVVGLDWLWIVLALLADLSTYGGGGYGNRERLKG